jgi:hypothetical protein
VFYVHRGVESHCVYLSAYELSFSIPGSEFATLTAAGLPTNLPLAGQSMRISRRALVSESARRLLQPLSGQDMRRVN